MNDSKDILVAILDDDKEYRDLLSGILDSTPGLRCIGAYKSYDDAMRRIESDSPDVLLLDIEMPVKSGIEALKIVKFHFPTVKILMLTVYSDSEKIFQSLQAGADGYLLKKSPANRLLDAIQEVYEGGAPFSGEVAKKVLQHFQSSVAGSGISGLSLREREILAELIEGHGTKAIADKLFVSTHTVRFHLHNIYVKLHVSSRAQAVAKVLKGPMG